MWNVARSETTGGGGGGKEIGGGPFPWIACFRRDVDLMIIIDYFV